MKGHCGRCGMIIDETEKEQNDGICYGCCDAIDYERREEFNNRDYGGWNKK